MKSFSRLLTICGTSLGVAVVSSTIAGCSGGSGLSSPGASAYENGPNSHSAVTAYGRPYAVFRTPMQSAVGPLRQVDAAFENGTIDECFAEATSPCVEQGLASGLGSTWIVCNGNTDCASSIYKLTVLTAPSGVTVTFSAGNVAPPTVVSMTGTFGRTVLPGPVSISFQWTVVSGSGPVPGTLTVPYQALCSTALTTCPLIDIRDVNLKKIVGYASSPPTTNTIVGKQISVAVEHSTGTGSGSYSTPTSIAWNIPGATLKSYNRAAATESPLSLSDLQGINPIFYWIEGATNIPSVTARLARTDGGEISDEYAVAHYNVQVPVSSVLAPVRGNVRVGTRYNSSGLFLSDGDAQIATAGINFTYSVTNTYGFGGQISGTQLIVPTYTYDGVVSNPTGGAYWLDNVVDYESPVPVGTTWIAIDAPAEVLTSAHETAAISGNFQMFLMYMPPAPSIWVTLDQVDWNWTATAARTADPNTWCLGGAPSCPATVPPSTPSATIKAAVSLPLWPNTYKNGTTRTPLRRLSNARVYNTTPVYAP